MDQVLDDRKKKILKAIIKTYMETGEPVGSRTISKFADLNVSSATIRNEMSDLTDMGYIVQPHTSAGRIPSDKGYRLYVDELMKEKEFSPVSIIAHFVFCVNMKFCCSSYSLMPIQLSLLQAVLYSLYRKGKLLH